MNMGYFSDNQQNQNANTSNSNDITENSSRNWVNKENEGVSPYARLE